MNELIDFIDKNPERDFANSERLGRILKITGRQVRSLAAAGVLPRQPDGSFRINSAVDAYIAHKTAPRPRASEALDSKRAEVIQRRLDREALHLIEMKDAAETVDIVIGALTIAFDQIAAESIAMVADKEGAIYGCAHGRAGMLAHFANQRAALIQGSRHADA